MLRIVNSIPSSNEDDTICNMLFLKAKVKNNGYSFSSCYFTFALPSLFMYLVIILYYFCLV